MEIFTVALLAVLVGMRHGLDGDHVAAIADMVGSEQKKRRQLSLGVMYALGHGSIVFVIGLLAIFVGMELPGSTKSLLELFVGLTLLVLGAVILISLVRGRSNYEYKSRLQIVHEWGSKLLARQSKTKKSPLALGVISAFLIGTIHGIGVESPTQIALLTGAAGLDNVTAAIMQLILFVAGLLASTILMTFCLSWGFLKAKLKKQLFFLLGSVTGFYSIGLGFMMMIEFWKGGV